VAPSVSGFRGTGAAHLTTFPRDKINEIGSGESTAGNFRKSHRFLSILGPPAPFLVCRYSEGASVH
jgi:hypothetical protein